MCCCRWCGLFWCCGWLVACGAVVQRRGTRPAALGAWDGRRERAVVISVCVPHCVWRIIYTREKCKSNQKTCCVPMRYGTIMNQFTLMANPSSSRASALERAREAAAAAAAARAAGAELAASRNMLVRVWRGADDLEMAGWGTAGCPATGRWGGG